MVAQNDFVDEKELLRREAEALKARMPKRFTDFVNRISQDMEIQLWVSALESRGFPRIAAMLRKNPEDLREYLQTYV
jgi:hypothetical protein